MSGLYEKLEKDVRFREGMKVIFCTHPIPEKYYTTHTRLKTWKNEFLSDSIKPTLAYEVIRLSYD